jgi:hypothetical protein
LADVVVLACRACHTLYDDPNFPPNVKPRVPKALLVRARERIAASGQRAPLKKAIRERLK